MSGPDLRAAREAQRVSLGKLAHLIGRDKGHLSRVERAVDDREVTPALLRDYERALGTTITSSVVVDDNVAATPVPHSDVAADSVADSPICDLSGPESSSLSDMRRRGLVGALAATALSAGPLGVLVAKARQPGAVGSSDVARLYGAAARLYALDYQHGGESLWQTAVLSAGDGYAMLEQGTYSPKVGQQLMRATGRMEMCAGWLASDAGRHGVARSCYNEALSLARQAGDPEIETHALANLAFVSNAVGQPREALRFAVAAERTVRTPGCSPLLAVMPHLRRGVAAALDGDARGSDGAIRDARAVLDVEADGSADEAYSFVSQSEIDGVEGTCAIKLGQPRRAASLLERAIGGHTDRYARTRALYRVRLAQARFDAGAVDGAAEAANTALDDLTGEVASWRVASELNTVVAHLAANPQVAGVDRVLARYAALRLSGHGFQDSEEQLL